MTTTNAKQTGIHLDDPILPFNTLQDGGAQDEDDTNVSHLLTEEILRRIYSFRFNPWSPKLKDTAKTAWLTQLELVEDRSRINSLARHRYAVVRSHDQKTFKIATESVTANDTDISAVSAFDMAMAASLNPKMRTKGVTVTAQTTEALFLLAFAVKDAGLSLRNAQEIEQLAQSYPQEFAAAQQQWESTAPSIKQAFNARAQESATAPTAEAKTQPLKQRVEPIIDLPETGLHAGKVPDWNPEDTADMIKNLHAQTPTTEQPETPQETPESEAQTTEAADEKPPVTDYHWDKDKEEIVLHREKKPFTVAPEMAVDSTANAKMSFNAAPEISRAKAKRLEKEAQAAAPATETPPAPNPEPQA